jgi:hypothetical protein
MAGGAKIVGYGLEYFHRPAGIKMGWVTFARARHGFVTGRDPIQLTESGTLFVLYF